MKKVINLNRGWVFSRRLPEDFSRRLRVEAEKVDLPHSWNVLDASGGGKNDLYQGKCAYQKELHIPAELKKIYLYLEFKGVNSAAELYVNGRPAGTHRGGFSAFRVEITPYVSFGQNNIITLSVDNSPGETLSSLSERFFFFGGIYRDVNLIVTGDAHFALDEYGSPGVRVVPRLTEKGGRVGISTSIRNPVSYDVINYTVYDQNGCAVGSATVNPKNPETIIDIPEPELWQGRRSPYLYSLRARLMRDAEILDLEEASFGFRTFEFDKEGDFCFNGQKTVLRGVTRHQDREGCGWIMSEEQQREDMRLIKEIGANAVRLPFYQNDQYFYDLCDKEGILVWTEIPLVSETAGDEEAKNIRRQLRELVKQCYNHPCICFFGIHNDMADAGEETLDEISALNQTVKKMDRLLLTASANRLSAPINSDLSRVTDLAGYNIPCGEDIGEFVAWADAAARAEDGPPLAISEYGCEGRTEYPSGKPYFYYYSEEYQALYHEQMWKLICSCGFLQASFVSSLFDYAAGEPDKATGSYISRAGLVSYDRQLKKDAFYFYKSRWAFQRFVHIAGGRNKFRAGRRTEIKIYTNCKRVSLFVNAKAVKSENLSEEKGIFIFEVKLKRGENKIRAVTEEGLADEITLIRLKVNTVGYAPTVKYNRIEAPPPEAPETTGIEEESAEILTAEIPESPEEGGDAEDGSPEEISFEEINAETQIPRARVTEFTAQKGESEEPPGEDSPEEASFEADGEAPEEAGDE